jgi:hypothetical protein
MQLDDRSCCDVGQVGVAMQQQHQTRSLKLAA